MNYEKKYKKLKTDIKNAYLFAQTNSTKAVLEHILPELRESEDERIRKDIIVLVEDWWDRVNKDNISTKEQMIAWLEKQKQDDLTNYKKTLSNYDEAEKEKLDFVGDGFINCYCDFQDFKEGETYWFEYIGDDKYNVRSDNLLGKTYHITPCQLYTIFKKQTWLEKQGEPTLKAEPNGMQTLNTWSEEDENILNNLINYLKVDDALQYPEKQVVEWLQFIKQRIGG